jgi:vacuolar-type H+-ATPase catalytic subunit A/Vma1
MLKLVLAFYRNCVEAAKRGVSVEEIKKLSIRDAIASMKRVGYEEFPKEQKKMEKQLEQQFEELLKTKKAPGAGKSE